MKLTTALGNIAKCFIAPNIIDKKKLNDELTFAVSMTRIDQAIKDGEITEVEAFSAITGKEEVSA